MSMSLKKIGIYALCLALVVGIMGVVPGYPFTKAGAAGAANQQLIATNVVFQYDFDDATSLEDLVADGWSKSFVSEPEGLITLVADSNGGKRLKYTKPDVDIPNSSMSGMYSPFIPLAGGPSIAVSFNVANDLTTDLAESNVLVAAYWYNSNHERINYDQVSSKAMANYEGTFSCSFAPPADAKYVRIFLFNKHTNDSCYFDNLEVVEVTEDNRPTFGSGTRYYPSLKAAGGDFTNMSPAMLTAMGWIMDTQNDGKIWFNTVVKHSEERGSNYIEGVNARSKIITPYVDVRGMTQIQVVADLAGDFTGTYRVYVYSYDENGNKLTPDGSLTMNKNVTEWDAYTTESFSLPTGTAYVQMMTQASASIGNEILVDNLEIVPAATAPTSNATEFIEDFNATTLDRMTTEGWKVTNGNIANFSLASLDGNSVLMKKNVNAQQGFRTPKIYVSGLEEVTLYVEAMSESTAISFYLYILDSNGDQIGTSGLQRINSNNLGKWVDFSYTMDLTTYEDAYYVQFMTYGAKDDVGYYDNLAINHTHAFTKKSNLIAQASPLAYYGECECGAISHIVTISDAPNTSAPATSAPATSAPATSAPATSAPATSAPATSAPATSAPATSAPATSAPATSAPATSAPATSAPATSAPATSAPATSAPATSAPATSSPATSAPSTSAPATTAPAGTNPDTGDTTGITGMLVVMILAATTLVAMVIGSKFNFNFRK